MDIARIRQLRLKPLATCLASALAFAASGAVARPVSHEMPREFTEILERLNAHDLPPLPASWQRPSPADFLLRAQPSRHEIPPVPAGSIVVQNCADSGAGSLRQAIDDADDGDTIDLTQLSCSTISLTTGSLFVGQTSLRLQGPGSKYLSITGNDTCRADSARRARHALRQRSHDRARCEILHRRPDRRRAWRLHLLGRLGVPERFGGDLLRGEEHELDASRDRRRDLRVCRRLGVELGRVQQLGDQHDQRCRRRDLLAELRVDKRQLHRRQLRARPRRRRLCARSHGEVQHDLGESHLRHRRRALLDRQRDDHQLDDRLEYRRRSAAAS